MSKDSCGGDADSFRFIWVVCCFAVAAARLGVWAVQNAAKSRGKKTGQETGQGQAAQRRAAQGRDLLWLCAALGMTAAADYYMVLYRENIRGLYCFLAVQLLYFVRLGRGSRALIGQLLVGGGAAALLRLAGVRLGPEGTLGVLYFTLFAGNIVWEIAGRGGRDRVFLAGLVLFILCDIHVGVMNLGYFVKLPDLYWQWIRPYSQRALWFFYLPSQALLAVSSCYDDNNKFLNQQKGGRYDIHGNAESGS